MNSTSVLCTPGEQLDCIELIVGLAPKIKRKMVIINQAKFGRTMVEEIFKIYVNILYIIPKEGEEYDDIPFEEIIENIIEIDKKSLNCFGNMEKDKEYDQLIQTFGVTLAKILASQVVIYENSKDETKEIVFMLKPKSPVEDLHVDFILKSGNSFVPFSLKTKESAEKKQPELYYHQGEVFSNSLNFPNSRLQNIHVDSISTIYLPVASSLKESSLPETRESKLDQDAYFEGKETVDANYIHIKDSKMKMCLEYVLSNADAFSQQIKSCYADKVELLISNLQGTTTQAPFTQTTLTENNSIKDKVEKLISPTVDARYKTYGDIKNENFDQIELKEICGYLHSQEEETKVEPEKNLSSSPFKKISINNLSSTLENQYLRQYAFSNICNIDEFNNQFKPFLVQLFNNILNKDTDREATKLSTNASFFTGYYPTLIEHGKPNLPQQILDLEFHAPSRNLPFRSCQECSKSGTQVSHSDDQCFHKLISSPSMITVPDILVFSLQEDSDKKLIENNGEFIFQFNLQDKKLILENLTTKYFYEPFVVVELKGEEEIDCYCLNSEKLWFLNEDEKKDFLIPKNCVLVFRLSLIMEDISISLEKDNIDPFNEPNIDPTVDSDLFYDSNIDLHDKNESAFQKCNCKKRDRKY
jgi:hypothetical protein